MTTQIELGGILIEVELKDIKNVHLSVYPPNGRVRITAPKRMEVETIRVFAISKLGWIKEQQKKFKEQERETPREYLERESHYFWGDRYLLEIIEDQRASRIELSHKRMILHIRPGSDETKKQAIVEEWYRKQIRLEAEPLIEKWEQKIGVKINRLYVQRMKTRWGSCKPDTGNIRLNTELAKKPRQCLEYIIVHELVHMIEPTHNFRFTELLNQFLPNWKQLRNELKRAPLGHVDWEY